METNQQEKTVFETGANRAPNQEQVRYDLISPIMLRRLAETCYEGAEKYGVGNAHKGIPPSNLLNHAIAHIEKWRIGDVSEDHLAHAIWNLSMIMHFDETSHPVMDDKELVYRDPDTYPSTN